MCRAVNEQRLLVLCYEGIPKIFFVNLATNDEYERSILKDSATLKYKDDQGLRIIKIYCFYVRYTSLYPYR